MMSGKTDHPLTQPLCNTVNDDSALSVADVASVNKIKFH